MQATVPTKTATCLTPGKRLPLFNVFSRLHQQSSYEGHGLGLAICRRNAANHSSDITLVSSHGDGADFTKRVPFA